MKLPNIYLIGFMGSGKTFLSKLIARYFFLQYLDLDEEIERRYKIKINDIFFRYGEKYFREIEENMFLEFCHSDNLVFATGGGTLIYNQNLLNIAKNTGIVIFLDTPFRVCWERIKHSDRPIVQTHSYVYLNLLYSIRRKIYKYICDYIVLEGKIDTLLKILEDIF